MPDFRTYTDKELLLHVAEGNESAFTQLFREWSPRLAAYVFKITESREVTEEIVQDVFFRVWERRADLVAVQNFSSYLFVMAKHRALNELRSIAAYLNHQLKYSREHSGHSDQDGGSSTHPLLEEALATLSERQREVWLLNRREQYTYQEIAIRLGISKETVKTHLQAATRLVTTHLEARQGLLLLLVTALS